MKNPIFLIKNTQYYGEIPLMSSLFLTVLGGFVANKGDTQAIVILIGAIFLVLGVYILFPTYLSSILIACLPIMKNIWKEYICCY